MGIASFFKRQFSSVIEWTDQQPEVLLYKFPAVTDEIKNASKLVVSLGQGCLLVYEGKITDVITEEGIYDLETDNHPFITNLVKLRQLFESEHKMHLYFYRKAAALNQPWGTPSPIKYMDSQYNIPVELGMYGNYSMQISNAVLLFKDLIGSKNLYTTTESKNLLLSRLPQTIISTLAQSKLSYLDIDAALDKLSQTLQQKLNAEFESLGLQLLNFKIQGTSFDQKTQERVGKIADITAESRAAAEGGLSYLEIEKLKALRDAARNEGGIAGAGVQLGFGLEMGKVLNDKKEEITAVHDQTDPVVQLKKLKLLLDEGILTQEEFDGKKKEILNKM